MTDFIFETDELAPGTQAFNLDAEDRLWAGIESWLPDFAEELV